MAQIYADYDISSLQVLVRPGESFTHRTSATKKDHFILVKLSNTAAVIVDVQRGVLYNGVFDLTWTERIAQIEDPQAPGEIIDDPNATPYFTADLDDVLAGAAGGMTIKQFLAAGWQFYDHGNLAHILQDQPDPDPAPEAP